MRSPIRENWPVVEVASLGAAQLASLLDDWSASGNGSLARRLAHVMRARIASGLLPAGAGLPPERSIAQAIGVSRSTVVAALDELRAEGFLASRQGSGTWVAVDDASDAVGGSAAERLLVGARNINLAASVPASAAHLPELAVDVADLASVTPAHGYAPAGLPVLRDAIAARHRTQGLETVPEAVHVTNGAQHALDLALGAVTRPGDVVAVEDPTYVGVFDVFAARRLRPLPLPLDAVDHDPGAVVKLCRAGRAKAVFLVPAVHSPTGRVRSARHARRSGNRARRTWPARRRGQHARRLVVRRRPQTVARQSLRAGTGHHHRNDEQGRVGWPPRRLVAGPAGNRRADSRCARPERLRNERARAAARGSVARLLRRRSWRPTTRACRRGEVLRAVVAPLVS